METMMRTLRQTLSPGGQSCTQALDKCEVLVKSSVSLSGAAIVPFQQHSVMPARGACCMLISPMQCKGMLVSCCLDVPI